MSKITKEYLGDGVYAEVAPGELLDDSSRLILTTENGHAITNTIVLELEVIEALRAYIIRYKPGNQEVI